MAAGRDPRPGAREPLRPDGYWLAARRPLNILVFLIPLIVAFELCLALVLPTGDGRSVTTVLAHKRLLEFFAAFGVGDAGGLFLGGLVIALVLFVWHLLAREPWRIDGPALGLMALESAILAVPLLLLSMIVARNLAGAAAPVPTPASFEALGTWPKMAVSVGAGLYEELAFRMVLIAVVHTLLVDLAHVRPWVGAAVAIGLSAAAFTWYHDLSSPGGGISARRVIFYFLAGLYFGAVYTLRGFGIVVGTHAVYDVLAVLLSDPG